MSQIIRTLKKNAPSAMINSVIGRKVLFGTKIVQIFRFYPQFFVMPSANTAHKIILAIKI